MLCDVCRLGLEGIEDPTKTRRLGLIEDFPEILERDSWDPNNKSTDAGLEEPESDEPERYIFGHHENYDSVLRSQQLGCVVCLQFSEVNDRDDVNPTFAALGYYSVFRVLSWSRCDAGDPVMAVYCGDPMDETCHDMVPHDEDDIINPSLSTSTSDAQTWSLVETWVDRCLTGHESCLQRDSTLFSPTRLLELRDINGEKSFRLVHRGEFDPQERYITLSHCWGPEPASKKLRLLQSTSDMLRKGLPVSTLPKTFRHAFEIVERLKVRHLWIDRLCIVQDSAADWQAEASTMQTIYHHGLINIAALGAQDDQAGCFFDREPALIAPTIINIWSRDDDASFSFRFDDEMEAWKNDFKGQPLLSRAWVLQERILSTRNLYFGSKQVFWECFESNHCETIPNATLVSKPRTRPAGDLKSDKRGWKPLIDPWTRSSERSETDWPAAVQSYSKCDLTFSRDKLVALSGLAKHMGDAMVTDRGPGYDNYLAGLWKHMMPRSLLWAPKTQGRPVSPYRAPSWSWASLDGDISFLDDWCSDWHVDVLEAEITPRGQDQTGELAGGTLTLRGYLCMAQGMERCIAESNGRDLYTIVGSYHHPESHIPLDFGRHRLYIQFDTPDDIHDNVFLLFIGSSASPSFSIVNVYALALVYTGGIRSSFRRVGCAWGKEDYDTEDPQYLTTLFEEFPFSVVKIV
ncbi:HET-domain-containing protein [Durotheca rogersii]|uniref:HET-domain-containing protein n=1 Tax=Durotheca rogersii TaxID=419775 RepID=UPI00221F9D68|nr:HET-domain-containing protein [Durotheca rogersii]KAI5859289.1 HET-domain-containing protein [Durotheca rogersii]